MKKLIKSDFDICNDECKRLIEKHGYDTPILNYPENSRCVVLVWTSYGKIENGGFNYLFGVAPPGDPYFEYTLESYKKIGCENAYVVFKNALCLFPDCKPPLDDHERIMYYRSASEECRDKLDSQFWATSDHIISSLALYIKEKRCKEGSE